MLLMGDEVRRSQHGNNNAYCQDNETSWFDWQQLDQQAGLLRFIRGLIKFTQESSLFRETYFWSGSANSSLPYITWHGTHVGQPDWGEDSHSLAFSLYHPKTGDHIHVMLNAYWDVLTFELLPLPAGESWRRVLDTALPEPDDFCDPAAAAHLDGTPYLVERRSSVLLLARNDHLGRKR